MKLQVKKYTSLFFIAIIMVFTTSCNLLFPPKQERIEIPEGITEAQLQDARYKYKRDNGYKEKFLYQNKTDSVVITIYNIINYVMKDDGTSIGEGFEYLIFDISIDNYTEKPFGISSFTKSCHLSNDNPDFAYSNVSFALKMYHLQTDSAEIEMDFINKMYQPVMPKKEFYRGKLFAFEVSKEDKEPLFFRYRISNQKYEYKIR